jgi:hypothetical protein
VVNCWTSTGSRNAPSYPGHLSSMSRSMAGRVIQFPAASTFNPRRASSMRVQVECVVHYFVPNSVPQDRRRAACNLAKPGRSKTRCYPSLASVVIAVMVCNPRAQKSSLS